MASFKQFWVKISASLVPPSSARLEKLAGLNPDRIYVENVRALLGTSTWIAKMVCETAARRGLLKKHVQVMCPDGSVALSLADDSQLPEFVRCWQEVDGEYEEQTLRTKLLNKLEFYAFERELSQ